MPMCAATGEEQNPMRWWLVLEGKGKGKGRREGKGVRMRSHG
ncbi:hypothetical protein [Streptomyces sp. NPDC057690]